MLENKYKVKCKNSMNKSNFKVDVVQHKHILRANDNIRKYKKVKKVPKYQPRILNFNSEIEVSKIETPTSSKEIVKSQVHLKPLEGPGVCTKRSVPRSNKKIKRIIINQEFSSKRINEDQGRSCNISESSFNSVSSHSNPRLNGNLISVDDSMSSSKFHISKFGQENSKSPVKLWTALISKAILPGVDPIKLSLFKLMRRKNMMKRAVNTLSILYLKHKESQRKKSFNNTMIGNWIKESEMQSGLQDNISDSSSDFSRGEEDEEMKNMNLKLQMNNKPESKSNKYMPQNLEPIPEASIRLEETIAKKSSNIFLRNSRVFSSKNIVKLDKPKAKILTSDDLLK